MLYRKEIQLLKIIIHRIVIARSLSALRKTTKQPPCRQKGAKRFLQLLNADFLILNFFIYLPAGKREVFHSFL